MWQTDSLQDKQSLASIQHTGAHDARLEAFGCGVACVAAVVAHDAVLGRLGARVNLDSQSKNSTMRTNRVSDFPTRKARLQCQLERETNHQQSWPSSL